VWPHGGSALSISPVLRLSQIPKKGIAGSRKSGNEESEWFISGVTMESSVAIHLSQLLPLELVDKVEDQEITSWQRLWVHIEGI
jgi:hypothetical protein